MQSSASDPSCQLALRIPGHLPLDFTRTLVQPTATDVGVQSTNRILAVAGRIVRTARRCLLRIDANWPWAETITTAHARLTALPAP